MKTTITLPDQYHLHLRKLALEQSTTMADLICEAIKEKFFERQRKKSSPLKKQSFNDLEGDLSEFKTSEAELKKLKKKWGNRI